MNRGRLSLAGLGLALVLIGFAAGVAARSLWAPVRVETHSLLSEAEALLRSHFLNDVPGSEDLQRGMIRGMLEVIGDPFTVYLEPAAHELMTDALTGEYGGIGVLLSRDAEGNIRLVPMEGSPAAQAGIVEGDILLAIDGAAIDADWSQDEIGAALRGAEGSTVRVRLAARAVDQAGIELAIERRSIPLPSATGFLQPERPDIGVIALTGFTEHTAQEVRQAFDDLVERGIQALILDLRSNPGGLLDAGVSVADFFLESGTIVIEQRRGQREVVHRAEDAGPASVIPLAVLVDGSTASSAEIVAAALQANQRAPLIGEATFGKGSVQLIFELADGSSLHITSARWLTPDRQTLDGSGLTPDVLVDPADGSLGDAFAAAAIAWIDAHGGGP